VSLKSRLEAEIAVGGPISVAAFMTRCLHDPQDGYYATRPALGAEGDFITAPLVSQMFGELIGLWAVEMWSRLGAPAQVLLVEAGPGDGTLMSDMLRAARLAPEFLAAARLYLLETSGPLRKAQAERLADAAQTPTWIDSLDDLPVGLPLILVANELLDCLPAHQFVRTPEGWAEQIVAIDDKGQLAFALQRTLRPDLPQDAPLGEVREQSPVQTAFASELAHQVVARSGAALLIDYGREAPGPGDTLQALIRHRKVDPLATAGEADLTVWADFPAVVAAARAAGAMVGPILPQGLFLQRLGIEARAAALSRARPDRAETITRQLARLTEPDQMGTLFKACAIYASGPTPPGFEEAP
jgi:NADH dehydrogenase [ubiquinone] 1 alpha subcomplex assembly factor 7